MVNDFYLKTNELNNIPQGRKKVLRYKFSETETICEFFLRVANIQGYPCSRAN